MSKIENLVIEENSEDDPLEVLETDSGEVKVGKYLAQIRRNSGEMAKLVVKIVVLKDQKTSRPN